MDDPRDVIITRIDAILRYTRWGWAILVGIVGATWFLASATVQAQNRIDAIDDYGSKALRALIAREEIRDQERAITDTRRYQLMVRVAAKLGIEVRD